MDRAFAEEIGAREPDEETIAELLELAATAAHSSERIAAPIACYLAGVTGRPSRSCARSPTGSRRATVAERPCGSPSSGATRSSRCGASGSSGPGAGRRHSPATACCGSRTSAAWSPRGASSGSSACETGVGDDGEALIEGEAWSSDSAGERIREAAGEERGLSRHRSGQALRRAPILVCTDGALAALGADRRRFRPNIVVEGVEGLGEREWVGRELVARRDRARGASSPASDARVTTIDPDTIELDPDVLRRVNEEFDGYGRVLRGQPGPVRSRSATRSNLVSDQSSMAYRGTRHLLPDLRAALRDGRDGRGRAGDQASPRRRATRSRAGFACPKGIAMTEVQNDPDRVLHPLRRVRGGVASANGAPEGFERVSWDEALDDIGGRLRAIRERHGGQSIGWYMGNPGRLLLLAPALGQGLSRRRRLHAPLLAPPRRTSPTASRPATSSTARRSCSRSPTSPAPTCSSSSARTRWSRTAA